MGIYTLSNMRDELRLLLGNRDVTALPDTRLTFWLNRAYLEIATRYQFYEMQGRTTVATVAGQYWSPVPADIHSVLAVFNDELGPLIQRAYRLFDGKEVDADSQGPPEEYTRFGVTFEWLPVPDAIYVLNVRYLRRPAVLGGDDDVALTPSEWDEVILQGALWRGLRALFEPDRALAERQEHLRLINSMPLADQIDDIDSSQNSTIGYRGTRTR